MGFFDTLSKRLAKASRKFLVAGSGISAETGQHFGLAILVGALTGFAVVAFRIMADFAQKYVLEGLGGISALSKIPAGAAFSRLHFENIFENPSRWIMLVLPAVGAVLGYLLIKRFASTEHARGTDSAINAYHRKGGYLPAATIPVKPIASVLTVGFGGSAGYEGPVTLLGAACGSFVATCLKLKTHARRILMAAGLSAGIAAFFQAPLAGAMFGFEIFYSSSDIEYETVLPSFTASAVSYSIFGIFYGWTPLFIMPPNCRYESGIRLLPYFVLAIVVTFGARFYISFFRNLERRFGQLKLNGALKVAIGGLATGAIGFFFPDILGTGYSVIQACFTAGQSEHFANYGPVTIAGFVCFFFMKAIATSFTVGSGGSGGVFAPAIVCGGALGAAVGLFFKSILPEAAGIHPASFALVGMAGFLASAIRIPLTAIVMVAEISGNHSLLVPAMWVCGISFWLNNDWSLYRSQVHDRNSSPVHN